MAEQTWFTREETVLKDSKYRSAIHDKFDTLENRIEGAFDRLYEVSTEEGWGHSILYVDPIHGSDEEDSGAEVKPYKTINYAYSRLPLMGDTQEEADQWLLEKAVIWCAPGIYTEGGTFDAPNDVVVGIKRARTSIQGDGVYIRGNLVQKYDISEVPGGWDYVTKYKPNQKEPYGATTAFAPLVTFDVSGDSGGMEGGHSAMNMLVYGAIKVLYGSTAGQTGTPWLTNLGVHFTMIDCVQTFGGIQLGTWPGDTVLGGISQTIEVDSSSIAGANIGSSTGLIGVGIKAHNTQLKSVLGPRIQILELDGCRIQGGMDRTYGGDTGNVSFSNSSSYSYITSCAIPATLFKVGSGTGTVTILGDKSAVKQLYPKTLDNGTGSVKLQDYSISSSTTAARPVATKFTTGYTHFDITLNKPIMVNAAGTGWVDSTGTAV